MQTLQGFISYAHDDHADFARFRRHLQQIELATGFHFSCDDARVEAGWDWNATILDDIRKSCVILLLASPDYFAARYVVRSELPEIRNCQRIDDALLIPVILRPCGWETLLGVPQAVPIAENR